MNKLSEGFRPQIALAPQSIASSNVTGKYTKVGKRATYYCGAGAMGTIAGNETAVFQVYKATSQAGADAAILTNFTITITAATKAQRLNILVNAPANGKYFILHGNTYTKAAAYSLANKEFSSLAELVTLINAVDTALYAVAIDGTNLSVEARGNPGEVELTATGIAGWEAAKLIPTTLEAVGIIEVKAGDLGETAGGVQFTHIALKCTTTATIVVSGHVALEDHDEAKPTKQNYERYMV